MTIKDLISFAKAGWKPADVREFLQEIEPESSAEPKAEPEADPEPSAEPEAEPEADPEPSAEPEAEPDYKKLYEDEKKEREKLQKANTKKEQPEEPTTQEKLNDIMRPFM